MTHIWVVRHQKVKLLSQHLLRGAAKSTYHRTVMTNLRDIRLSLEPSNTKKTWRDGLLRSEDKRTAVLLNVGDCLPSHGVTSQNIWAFTMSPLITHCCPYVQHWRPTVGRSKRHLNPMVTVCTAKWSLYVPPV